MTAQLAKKLDNRLAKIRWQQDLARRGQERKQSVSPELAEALRKEILVTLEAGGKPFDVNVARRVYDLAIAARDMCIAATDSVKEAIDQIKDTNGPMETLQDPNAPESGVQASETFGARIFRELMAILPSMRSGGQSSGDDPRKLVHALAEARSRGMLDVAEELEVKLFGKALTGSRPVDPVVAVNLGSFEHGFSDGKLNLPPESNEPDYKAGYLRGTEARFLERECVCPAFDNSRDGLHHDQACPRFARVALDDNEIARLHPDTKERYAQNALAMLGAVGATP